ncbi:nucleotidyl transferase AbiEii/AbiGii toxin family protein [Candidatus Fermentibacteria bacterium]|nr:nucleotidyl transferase AbiEii/AbiGii toxin family protein [Candidatus Fermentibacteria bacterium]
MLEPEIVFRAFPNVPPGFRRAILREYLQLKVLDFVFGRMTAAGLVFMGGSAIHLFHGSDRFSEDLDFDSRGVSANGFATLAHAVAREFELEGVACSCSAGSPRNASTAVLRFVGILQAWGLTAHRDEVLRLKLDAAPQEFPCQPDMSVLNRLDVICSVPVMPPGLLLSHKLRAILERNRLMGRDIYDASCLFGFTTPDMAYLEEKCGLSSPGEVVSAVKARLGRTRQATLEGDVAPFITSSRNLLRMSLFPATLDRWVDNKAGRLGR